MVAIKAHMQASYEQASKQRVKHNNNKNSSITYCWQIGSYFYTSVLPLLVIKTGEHWNRACVCVCVCVCVRAPACVSGADAVVFVCQSGDHCIWRTDNWDHLHHPEPS